MKRNYITIVFSLMLTYNCFSQISLSYGGSIIIGQSDKYVDINGNTAQIQLTGGSLWARYIIGETKISVGVPASAMFNLSVGNQTGVQGGLGIDLPLTAEYNFGLGSLPKDAETDAKFGGFFGAGFSYTYSSSSYNYYIPGVYSSYETVKGSSYGPLAHVGFRAIIGNRPYGLRLFYKYGLEKARFKTFGASLYYSL